MCIFACMSVCLCFDCSIRLCVYLFCLIAYLPLCLFVLFDCLSVPLSLCRCLMNSLSLFLVPLAIFSSNLWYLNYMVTQNTLRTGEGKQVVFEEKKNQTDTAVDLNKCLKQIKLPI